MEVAGNIAYADTLSVVAFHDVLEVFGTIVLLRQSLVRAMMTFAIETNIYV